MRQGLMKMGIKLKMSLNQEVDKNILFKNERKKQ